MYWWLAIALIITAALAYGYWDHTGQSRQLARLFANLAAKYQGEVKKADLLALPQLRFEKDGCHLLVSAMETSGHVVAGTSGYTGPFTFVDLNLPFDTAQKIRVERSDANLLSGANRLIEAMTPLKRPKTGHVEFDRAFDIKWEDQAFAFDLLNESVREKLLNSLLPRLDVRVDGNKISVHTDGIAKSEADLQELIEIAVLLADNCP
jgi:hypothetical protein